VTSVENLSFKMADGNTPSGFQKGGNVSRSPRKDINNRAIELNRLRQVLEVVPYEPMALLNDTQRQFIREMALQLGLEGEKLIQEVADYIDGILQQEEVPLKAEKVLGVVSSKLKELEDDVGRNNRGTLQGIGTMCPSLLPAPAKKPWSHSRRVEKQEKMLMLPR
jgi:hypothetical protein